MPTRPRIYNQALIISSSSEPSSDSSIDEKSQAENEDYRLYPDFILAARDRSHSSSPWLTGHNVQPDSSVSLLKATDYLPNIEERSGRKKVNKIVQQLLQTEKSVANIRKNTAKKLRNAGRPENILKSCPFYWKRMAMEKRILSWHLERYVVYRLNKRLKAVHSQIQSIGRFAADQPQPLAVVPWDASERNTEQVAEVAPNDLVPIADGQEEPPLVTTLVQAVINLVSGLLGVNIFTCLLVLLLIDIALFVYKEDIWGPSTAEGRYQAKMQKSGPGLKCLFFLLHLLNVPIF